MFVSIVIICAQCSMKTLNAKVFDYQVAYQPTRSYPVKPMTECVKTFNYKKGIVNRP